MELEAYYYNQDDKYKTVIIIDHEKHLAHKILNVKEEECENNSFTYISIKTANVLISGLNKAYYSIDVITKEDGIDFLSKKLLDFMVDVQKKYSNPEYWAMIQKEYELSDKMNQCTIKYWDLVEKSEKYLKQSNLQEFETFILKKGATEYTTEIEKLNMLADIMLHKNENGFSEIQDKLKNDQNFSSFLRLQSEIKNASVKLMEASLNLAEHFGKELDLFSNDYQKRIDEFANEGLFLYFMNTPDWPLEDNKYTLEDIINYELFEDGLHLWEILSQYIENVEMGDIYKREADDLKASYILLNMGLYWSSLRNMYSLLDHHHKLCADAFNGFAEQKKSFKNGKERSDRIGIIMRISDRYEKIWKKLDKAIQEINSKNGSERFVSRNAIVHGDYEKEEIKPTAMDVVKIMFLYVTLRKMVDKIKVFEQVLLDYQTYLTGYLINKAK